MLCNSFLKKKKTKQVCQIKKNCNFEIKRGRI